MAAYTGYSFVMLLSRCLSYKCVLHVCVDIDFYENFCNNLMSISQYYLTNNSFLFITISRL